MGFFSFFSKNPNKNRKLVTRTYTLGQLKISVEAETVEGLDSKVYLENYSKSTTLSTGFEHSSRQLISTSEFFADVNNMINFMHTRQILDGATAFNTLDNACQNHISKFGRLFESDLRAYVLTLMKIVDAVSVAHGIGHIPDDEDANTKASLAKFALAKYEDYIAY